MLQNHRGPAVVHEDAGVIEGEFELDGLARRDRAILVLGDTMAAWKSIECIIGAAVTLHAGHGLVAAIRHREADLVADAGADRWSRHLVAEGPATEFHARRDLDDLMGRVQADILHGRRIERPQRRRHGQRGAGGKGARLPRGGDPGRRRLEVHRGRVVRIGRGGGRASQAARASARSQSQRHVGRRCWMPGGVRPLMSLPPRSTGSHRGDHHATSAANTCRSVSRIMSTGISARRSTASATEPNSSRPNPLRL